MSISTHIVYFLSFSCVISNSYDIKQHLTLSNLYNDFFSRCGIVGKFACGGEVARKSLLWRAKMTTPQGFVGFNTEPHILAVALTLRSLICVLKSGNPKNLSS